MYTQRYKSLCLAILGSLMLGGCFSTSYFVLSTASEPGIKYTYKKQVIGVEKVTVPEYLFKREIAVAKTASQIELLPNATWAEDLDAGLTQRLISFLQKKFNPPHVYAYAWDVDRQPTLKVKVHVTRFIAQGAYVYLDANWEVENMRTHNVKARLFSTKVPTAGDATSIVASMDKAFAQLEEAIADGIRR